MRECWLSYRPCVKSDPVALDYSTPMYQLKPDEMSAIRGSASAARNIDVLEEPRLVRSDEKSHFLLAL